MAISIHPIELIVKDADVKRGQPCIHGTTTRVLDLVMPYLFHHRSAEMIASDFSLGLAEVHAALAYYYLHIDEMNAAIQAEDARFVTLTEKIRDTGKTQLLP